MSKLAHAQRRWSWLSEYPRLLSSSAGAGWRGFEFQEIESPENGTFDAKPHPRKSIMLSQICGPMKVRYGGTKKPFIDVLPYPHLSRPDERCFGAWQGAQRGLHLFIEVETFERFNQQPFFPDTLPELAGPNPSIEHLLRVLHFDVQNGHPSGPLLGESILAALLRELLARNAALSNTPKRVELSRGEFDRVREWIDANLAQPFSLEDLAREVGVSLRHLQRAFPAATGVSPYRYIMMQRVDRARSLIQASRLSLSEIATTTGFCDQAHMANTFRKLLNVSPSHFGNMRK
ncbi:MULTISPECIES: AraC family transcriptional regulator [unclassified Methylobacterium]|jgi:AraC-like DNA-binding protein|uniref:AraC family transcriptional regulator n=1 Tax=unclassified Methylobacterium TaxID=2615210 RepID=UPI00137123B7|nr:helix-turn-helix domain-containing protein [Methylobacterium sp. 2A]